MRLLLLACLLFGAGALRAQRSETDSLLGPPASRVQVFGSVRFTKVISSTRCLAPANLSITHST
jgi:hypothetical protein